MKLHHIGIAVKDLEAAVQRYQLLGLKELDRGIVEQFNVAVSMLDSGGETKLELLQPIGDGAISKFLEKNGEGLHHMAYGVPSISEKLDELKSYGVQLIDEVPRPGFGGHKVAFLHPKSFGGVLVELVENE